MITMMKVRDLEKAESKPRSSQSEGQKKRLEKKWRKWESNATSTVTKPKCKYLNGERLEEGMLSKSCSSALIGKWNRTANTTQQLKKAARSVVKARQVMRTWNQHKTNPTGTQLPIAAAENSNHNLNHSRPNTFLYYANIARNRGNQFNIIILFSFFH